MLERKDTIKEQALSAESEKEKAEMAERLAKYSHFPEWKAKMLVEKELEQERAEKEGK